MPHAAMARGGTDGPLRPSFIFTLGALTAVSATAVDICIPAQPEIAVELGQSPAAGAALVTAYLMGYAPGQIIWGPLSDRFGRLGPLYIALSAFLVTAVIGALASSMDLLVASRFVQGLAGGAAPVIARAIARDQGGGPATARLISTMTVILGGAPLLAPTLGSGLLVLFDWPSVFWFLAVFGLILIGSTRLFVPVTAVHANDPDFDTRSYLGKVIPILGAREFLHGLLLMSAVFFGYASILAVGAAMAKTRYGVDAQAFGPLFAVSAAFFVAGSIIARQAMRKLSMDRILTVGAILAALSGGALFLMADASPPLWALWGAISVYMLSFGFVLPTATAKALEPAGAAAGAASSIIGAVGTMSGSVGSWLAGTAVFIDSYQAICILMAIAGAVAILIQLLFYVVKSK